MRTAWSAMRAWAAPASASLKTATVSSPSSRHARMIRTAISPRLATRTRRKGRSPRDAIAASRAVSRPGAGPASLRKDGALPDLERDVPMLLSRIGVALRGKRLEACDEPRPRLGRADDVVDIAAT